MENDGAGMSVSDQTIFRGTTSRRQPAPTSSRSVWPARSSNPRTTAGRSAATRSARHRSPPRIS